MSRRTTGSLTKLPYESASFLLGPFVLSCFICLPLGSLSRFGSVVPLAVLLLLGRLVPLHGRRISLLVRLGRSPVRLLLRSLLVLLLLRRRVILI